MIRHYDMATGEMIATDAGVTATDTATARIAETPALRLLSVHEVAVADRPPRQVHPAVLMLPIAGPATAD